MFRQISGPLLLVCLLATASCGDEDAPPSPTEPTPTTVTETFSGTLTVNGAATHSFTVTRSGSITATLTSLAPDSTAVIGMSLGTWNGTTCQIVLARDASTQGSAVVGNGGSSGNFCVRVYDVGRLTGPADYTLTVAHF